MNLIEEIKSRITTEEILAELGIFLKRGRTKCPIHYGKNPTSFRVKNDHFICYSCGVNGDIITLTQHLFKYDFKKALKYLADKAGIRTDLEGI